MIVKQNNIFDAAMVRQAHPDFIGTILISAHPELVERLKRKTFRPNWRSPNQSGISCNHTYNLCFSLSLKGIALQDYSRFISYINLRPICVRSVFTSSITLVSLAIKLANPPVATTLIFAPISFCIRSTILSTSPT